MTQRLATTSVPFFLKPELNFIQLSAGFSTATPREEARIINVSILLHEYV
jgi:hypothetical protein